MKCMLFVIQNKLGTMPNNNLHSISGIFFSDNETWNGKMALYDFANNLYGVKEVSRFISRSSDSKRRK